MRTKTDLLRLVVPLLVLCLFFEPALAAAQEAAVAPQPSAPSAQSPSAPPQNQNDNQPPPAAPSSPAAERPPNDQLPDSPSSSQSRTSTAALQSSSVQPSAVPQQSGESTSREPVGTAAAETIPTTGVAASRPAGAAFAPAKQRQVRSLLIKMGAIIGAGVAIGTAYALSAGSPSKPPGGH